MNGYKRAGINGTSPLDIKEINDNFSALWLKVFGDINMADLQKDIKNVLYTNWLQPQGEGNLDSAHPLIIRFYIPETTKEIKKATMNFLLSHYRMDSDVANNTKEIINLTVNASTQSETKSSNSNTKASLAVTGPISEAKTYDTVVSQDNLGQPHNHAIGVPEHQHNIEHTHDISHTHTITTSGTLPPHTHPLNKGIVEDADALPNITVKVNTKQQDVKLNNTNTRADKVDIKENLIIGDWNTIEVSCSAKSETERGIARITVYGIAELLQSYK